MPNRHARLLFAVLALGACGCGSDESRGRASRQGGHPHEVRGESTFAFRAPPEGAKPRRGGTVIVAYGGDVDSFNPFTSSSAEASDVHDLLFPRLMHEQPNYNEGPPDFEPYLAESWTFGEDALSIRFTLREAKWSDGTPITAEDVRFSWQAARHPQVAWVSASIVDFIDDVEIHSPREFTVRYAEKYPYQLMDVNDIQILPRHAFGKVPFARWREHGGFQDEARTASGGPFLLEGYKQKQEITLGRNPNYFFSGKPYVDRVVFRVIPDASQRLSSIRAGESHFMAGIPPREARTVLDDENLMLYTYVTRRYEYAGWNNDSWPFDDARVRRALTHAIDRNNIVESVFYGYAEVAAPQIITTMWASNDEIEPLPYDPEKAVALLNEAGFQKGSDGVMVKDGKPFRFKLFTNAENEVRREVANLVQQDLSRVGVKADIEVIEFNLMSQQLKLHQIDAYLGGWNVATKVDMKPIWHSTSNQGQYNYVNFADDRVDEIIETARTMSDFQKAKPLWDELQVILDREQPYTMLVEPRGLTAINRRLVNVKVTALRQFDNLDEWWFLEAD